MLGRIILAIFLLIKGCVASISTPSPEEQPPASSSACVPESSTSSENCYNFIVEWEREHQHQMSYPLAEKDFVADVIYIGDYNVFDTDFYWYLNGEPIGFVMAVVVLQFVPGSTNYHGAYYAYSDCGAPVELSISIADSFSIPQEVPQELDYTQFNLDLHVPDNCVKSGLDTDDPVRVWYVACSPE